MLLPALPLITLLSVLPVPLIAAAPIKVIEIKINQHQSDIHRTGNLLDMFV